MEAAHISAAPRDLAAVQSPRFLANAFVHDVVKGADDDVFINGMGGGVNAPSAAHQTPPMPLFSFGTLPEG